MSKKKPEEPMTHEELERLLPQLEVIEYSQPSEPDLPLHMPPAVIDLGWLSKKVIPSA